MFSLPSRLSTVGLVLFVTLCTSSPLHKPETVEFKGQDIQCIPVDFPGVFSKAYCLVEGYGPDNSKAVLKFLHSTEHFSGEVENAKEFDQWLDDDGKSGIMLKDIQTDYPKPGDVKKQLHQWVAEHLDWKDKLDDKVAQAKKTIMLEVSKIADTKEKVLTDLSDNAFLNEDLTEASFCDLDPRFITELKGKPENIKELQKKQALDLAEENLNERYTPYRIRVRLETLGRKGIPCYNPRDSELDEQVD